MARRFIGGMILSLALQGNLWAAAPATAVIATPPQPTWQQLQPKQKEILAPLVNDWDAMENFRRKKWLGIAERYPQMGPEEQQRMQQRMQEWAKMTPEQRSKVRSNYKDYQQLPPEKKAEIEKKWQSYSNLPEEDKNRLKEGKKPASKAAPEASAASTNSAPQPTAITNP